MAQRKYQDWLQPENLTLLQGWARDGVTGTDIAGRIGIRPQTLSDWKQRFPEIAEALKSGAAVADYRVESALYKTATGYWVDEWADAVTPSGSTVRLFKHRYIQPSPTAQIFWLKNRKPKTWRDKPIEQAAHDAVGLQSFMQAIMNVPSEQDIAKLFAKERED